MRLIIAVSFLIVVNTCLKSQASIDFFPKSLPAELKKLNVNEAEMNELNEATIAGGKYFTLPGAPQVAPVKYVFVGRVKTCRAGGCSIKRDTQAEKDSEYFDYFILYDAAGAIKLVKVYNCQTSHGQEITSSSWLKQFRNYNAGADLVVGKNVDGISGATISVDAITADIEHKTRLLKQIIAEKMK